jgi:hypothetical protein
MTAVGTITLTAMALLASQLHSNALQVASGADGWEFMLLVVAVGLWAAVLFPFDFVGGYLLPKHFQRAAPPLSRFALGWMRGVLVQSGLIALLLWCILQAAQIGGLLAAIGTVIVDLLP